LLRRPIKDPATLDTLEFHLEFKGVTPRLVRWWQNETQEAGDGLLQEIIAAADAVLTRLDESLARARDDFSSRRRSVCGGGVWVDDAAKGAGLAWAGPAPSAGAWKRGSGARQ